MRKKNCPKCNGKLEMITGGGLPAEEFPEEPWYRCNKCNHCISETDYNKL